MPNKPSANKTDREIAFKERAWGEYTVKNWDKKGRNKLDELTKSKTKITTSQYEKWNVYDKYLLETHLVGIRKEYTQQMKKNLAADEQRRREDEARALRAEKRKGFQLAEKREAEAMKIVGSGGKKDEMEDEDETYQRRNIEANRIFCFHSESIPVY